jgi:hypothetical protein
MAGHIRVLVQVGAVRESGRDELLVPEPVTGDLQLDVLL